MIERVGPVEMQFELRVVSGVLVYRELGTVLRLGPARLRLPRRWPIRVAASETPAGPDRIHVSVEVTVPILGLLLAYDGTMTITG